MVGLPRKGSDPGGGLANAHPTRRLMLEQEDASDCGGNHVKCNRL